MIYRKFLKIACALIIGLAGAEASAVHDPVLKEFWISSNQESSAIKPLRLSAIERVYLDYNYNHLLQHGMLLLYGSMSILGWVSFLFYHGENSEKLECAKQGILSALISIFLGFVFIVSELETDITSELRYPGIIKGLAGIEKRRVILNCEQELECGKLAQEPYNHEELI